VALEVAAVVSRAYFMAEEFLDRRAQRIEKVAAMLGSFPGACNSAAPGGRG